MKRLLDSNVWLALAVAPHFKHRVCDDWLKRQAGRGTILFCRSTQQSFLRLLTTAAILEPYHLSAFSNAEAWAVYEKFREDDRIAFCEEPSGLDAVWKRFSARDTQSPKVWMDAYLAAFAVAGGHQFVTTDGAFQQYKNLNPIVLTEPALPL